ncbi:MULTISPECIES: non-ribosomal peptide synthetase [unclassified Alcanivorax]|jgi:enterobactin synthetase component F|uniref:non-ribosomal peptide synthetase n=1 Tax=unclassified Alcanivorax TaxID=2638842 RepID=UPI0004BC1176|nr:MULTISPECIES: non-ribosomal peptide synthetase [unclassified Alcanivorax]PKG01356.1 non-ribosomal peptide synthetase [Alcanivorax sp. 97CO-6]
MKKRIAAQSSSTVALVNSSNGSLRGTQPEDKFNEQQDCTNLGGSISPEVKSLPLASAQRGLWFGEQIGPKDAVYNIAEYCEILGEIKVDIFIAALKQITQEAETTRVEIHDTADGPRQIILDRYKGEFPVIDLSGATDPRSEAEKWMMDELHRPVDHACDPLWFCALFKISEQCYFWYQRSHHLVLDGFSAGIISRRCAEIYNALLEHRDIGPSPFLPLRIQHEQEQRYRESARYERDRNYWINQLSGLPDPVSLTRHNAVRAGGMRRSTAQLSIDTSNTLRNLGKDTKASLPQILIGLFSAYIYRMTGADDLVFGMPVSARPNRDMRSIPSMMANAVSIRLAMNAELNLSTLTAQVSKAVRQALRHQMFRYEDLRRELGLLGQGQQISWVGVNIEPFDYDLRFGGHQCLAHNISNGTVEDLTVFIYDRGAHAGLRIDLDANPALYSQHDLDTHRDRFVRLISSVVNDPSAPIGNISLLSEFERKCILDDWNKTEKPLPDTNLLALFDSQAIKTPDSIALTSGDKKLTYQQLQSEVVRLSHALIQRGIGSGDIVAVALPRDESMPIALLAIMRTGAAYLPLDPTAPAERLALVLGEGKPTLILSASSISRALFKDDVAVLNLDTVDTGLAETSINPAPIHGNTSAYVIYTSGSTGRPKGVEISHRALLNFLLAMQDELQVHANDKLLALTTVAFDIAALELYLPLISGAEVVIASREIAKDPEKLAALIADEKINLMQATPSHWQALLADYADQISNVRPLVGGEALPAQLAHKMRKLGHPIINLYGPTETTIWSTIMKLDGDDLDAPPIGRPIQNTTVYVLDQEMQPVPLGAIGELYIGGVGLAKGYLHRPELTAERFIENPFGAGRLYKTGDLVRWRADGVLDYLGRNDFQIKIRGFRIEAEDVESNIQRCEGVKQAVVTLRENPDGEKRLVAHFVPCRLDTGESAIVDTAVLRKRLAQSLPDYMIPSVFMCVDTLPTNVNGKLDRNALPEPTWQASLGYVAPRTTLETQLAALWCEIFGRERIGIHDSFFDLGGDSLTAARMVSRLRELLTQDIPLAAIFEASTIAELAAQLEHHQSVDPLDMMLPLKSSGTASPLFCIHPVIGLSWSYSGLTRYLDKEQQLYGVQARGLATEPQQHGAAGLGLPTSITEMAGEYIEQLRRVQPAGPYKLLGWSLGGLVAHEIARLLEAEGEEIGYLAVLDSYPYVQQPAQLADEAQLVQSALTFMGLASDSLPQGEESMANLSDLLCREYDIHNLPFVKEMQQSNGNIIESVRLIIENNLVISRQFTPGKIKAAMLFIAATETVETDMVDVLHNSADIWQEYVGKLTIHHVDCHHQDMFDAPALTKTGPLIADSLMP